MRSTAAAPSPINAHPGRWWQEWPRVYFAVMACVLVAAATAKALSIRVQPALAAAPDPVIPGLQSGTLQWAAIAAEAAVAIVLIAGRNTRRSALVLMGLGLAFLSYRAGLAFAGSAACGCLGHSSVTGLSSEAASRLGVWIIGAALAGSCGVLASLRSQTVASED